MKIMKQYSNDKLSEHFEESSSQFFRQYSEYQENRDWEMWANLKQKEDICKKVEQLKKLVESGQVTNDQFAGFVHQIREYQVQWKQVGPVARNANEKVWNKFVETCNFVYKPCLDFKRLLCNKVLELSEATDSIQWNKNSKIVSEIQNEWNRIGPLPLVIEGDLRKLFQNNSNLFYENRRSFFQKRDEDRVDSLKIKTNICVQAEMLQDSDKFGETATLLINLQKQWKKMGLAPKEEEPLLWKRFKNACNHFFARFDAVKEENLILKQQLCQEVEDIANTITEDSDLEVIRRQFINLQNRWKRIGQVPNKDKKTIWERFHKPCNEFFTLRKKSLLKMEPIFNENKQLLEQFINTVNETSQASNFKDGTALVKELQKEWKKVGPVFPGEERKLQIEFRKACDKFFSNSRQHYLAIHKGKEENLKIKENICLQIDSLIRIASPKFKSSGNSEVSMAEQLNIALELKDEIQVSGNSEQTLKNAIKKIRTLELKWKNTGPVPKEQARAIKQRFQKGMDELYSLRQK
ncbi:MAG: hypothetical protein B6I31_02770 [Desulfobacteraceae bacterium 4572_19]|nr:MAG: hypothetical protein B6I31_02770 [Desulfobacteraceae bacterium 4572_19]